MEPKSKNPKRPAGLEAAASKNPEDEEKRRAEVKFLADSKRKWREKIAKEKAELKAKQEHRAAMKKAEDERARMMAQQAAAERAKRGGDAATTNRPKPKPKPMPEWVDPVDDDEPKSLADLAIPIKPKPGARGPRKRRRFRRRWTQPFVQKGAAKPRGCPRLPRRRTSRKGDAKPVITYKPIKMKPKSPEKPAAAEAKKSPAKPKPNLLGSFEAELVAIQAELDASVDAHAAALALTAAAPRIRQPRAAAKICTGTRLHPPARCRPTRARRRRSRRPRTRRRRRRHGEGPGRRLRRRGGRLRCSRMSRGGSRRRLTTSRWIGSPQPNPRRVLAGPPGKRRRGRG